MSRYHYDYYRERHSDAVRRVRRREQQVAARDSYLDERRSLGWIQIVAASMRLV